MKQKDIRDGNFFFPKVQYFNFTNQCIQNWGIRANWENNAIRFLSGQVTTLYVNSLSVKPTKWSNTLKQFVGKLFECV